jgi:hypothetical protein
MVLNNRHLNHKSKGMDNIDENSQPGASGLERVFEALQILTNTVQQIERSQVTLTDTVEKNQVTSSLNAARHEAIIQQIDRRQVTLTDTVEQNQVTNSLNAARHEAFTRGIHDNMQHMLYPLYGNEDLARCVIDSGNHPVLTTSKNGVYTWVRLVGQEVPYIIGSAHCALSTRTVSLAIQQIPGCCIQDFTFVELPTSILRKEVLEVLLLGPYDRDFTNPLPADRDMILIQVTENPSFSVCKVLNAPPVGFPGCTSLCTLVGGLAHGSIVSSQDGLVSVKPGTLARTGTLEFFPKNNAEPGDSGTLLHIKRHDSENPTSWEPSAVLRGVSPPISRHSTRRCIGALIPPRDQFTSLEAVDLFQLYPNAIISCHVGTKDGYFNCYVHPEASVGPRAVKLVSQHNGACKIGVFVRNEKPIEFTGEKELAMNGSMLPDPSIARKRSFSEA